MKQKKDLESIPGVGKKISKMLNEIGIYKVNDLRGKGPEDLYRKLELLKGWPIDRCVLYVFRCAVYFAENENHDPSLLVADKLEIFPPSISRKAWTLVLI